MKRPELSVEDIVAVLNRHGVDYVVIGAFAAIAQGVPLEATHDVDVTPSRGAENLGRLSAALDELDARIRVDDNEEGLAFDHDAASLTAMAMLNLTCAAGDFDIVFSPAASSSMRAGTANRLRSRGANPVSFRVRLCPAERRRTSNDVPACMFAARPPLEVAGFEPASSGAAIGLLRAQPASDCRGRYFCRRQYRPVTNKISSVVSWCEPLSKPY